MLFSSLILAQQNYTLTAQISKTKSIGVFEKDWESGEGINLQFHLNNKSITHLFFDLGFYQFTPNSSSNILGNKTFRLIPLQVGAKFYLMDNKLSFFLITASGINIIFEDYTDETVLHKKTHAKLNFQIGGGAGFPITENVTINLVSYYNFHLLHSSIPYNLTYLEYGIQVGYRF
jgi:opacity protein-like surface antigen